MHATTRRILALSSKLVTRRLCQSRTAASMLRLPALVLNFVPDPVRATAEMHRAVRVGGTVAAYVWDYADGMQLLRRFWDAAVALDPAARELDEGRRFPLCRREALRSLLNDVGLERTEVQAIDVPTVFKNFDDYLVTVPRQTGPGARLLYESF